MHSIINLMHSIINLMHSIINLMHSIIITLFDLYPVAMWLPGVLSRADGAFICLWLVFYSLKASG